MNSSKRARYFHMMNRARQSKEKEPKEAAKEEKTNKQKHKPISAYFLPKTTTTPVLEVAPPPIPTPTLSYSPKKKPSEKTIQGIF